ncbi:MAG: ABC transporter substrate-binding protein [Anaerolineae bacterium]|nr:ABC transporter substrate-binding protein [Anaerolineae bacterium]
MTSKLNRRSIGWVVATLVLLVVVAAVGWFVFRPDNEAIYIAVVGPISGEDASYGEEQIQSVTLCMEEINQQGGVNGRPIKFITFDDQSDEAQATAAAQQAAKSQAVVVIGHIFSFTSLKGGEVYRQASLPAITGACIRRIRRRKSIIERITKESA